MPKLRLEQIAADGATFADNTILRADGTDGQLQSTGITISDTNEVRNLGTVEWNKGGDIASAAALALGADGNYFDVTGTTTVTSISSKPIGTRILLHADTGFTITHGANLEIAGAASLVLAAMDHVEFVSRGSGQWRECNRATAAGGSTDGDAIHDNVAGEINAIAAKASVDPLDLLVIEDSESANAKKKVLIRNLPSNAAAEAAEWEFSSLTADADPGIGVFRMNNATLASVTFLYVDSSTVNVGGIGSALAGGLRFGDQIVAQAGDKVVGGVLWNVTGTPTVVATYVKIPVSLASGSGSPFVAGEPVHFRFFHKGRARLREKTITIEDPVTAEDISFFFVNRLAEVLEMRAVVRGSTPSALVFIRHGTDRSAAGTLLVTAGNTITSQTTGSDITAFDNATISADSFVWLETTTMSGTIEELSITIFYRESADT